MTVTECKEAGYLETTKTKKSDGVTWYADANTDCWWNFEMTACIVKRHSSKYVLCDSNMNALSFHTSFKEAAEDYE